MSKQKPADTEDELSVLLSTRNITIAGRGLVIREYTLVDMLQLGDKLDALTHSLAEVLQTPWPLIEEIEAGLRAVPAGQREAALSQGFSDHALFRYVLLPQGLANAWQPVVGQYLNLMKLSSLASGIGFAELTYQVRQIESYNAHALEAFAVGTALYLVLGVVMGMALARLGPGATQHRSAQHER